MADRTVTAPELSGTAEVLELVAAAKAHDGVAPLSEHSMLALRAGHDRALIRRSGGTLVAYGQLHPATDEESATAELVVHPAHRRQGHGRALLRALFEEAAGPLRVWAHGDLPSAAALASTEGLARVRVLLQLRRSLADPLPPVSAAGGVGIRTFQPGRDEEAWLEVNRRAFADHPEQGKWVVDDVLEREREEWFDPAGFFLAERDGGLVGFHWTKVHSADLGEIYVLGIDPGAQGLGLGRTLALVGLHHLRERGIPEVMLYVEESNPAAVRLYESLGFTRHAVDVMYARPS